MLPDTALVRILTCEPPVAEASALVAALDKLFAQFVRENRCSAWTVTVEVTGRAVVLAWEGGPLSGCSHDKINGVMGAFAPQALISPPILIEGACLMRGDLKRRLGAGEVGPTTPWWDVRVTTLGDWRRQPQELAQGWLWAHLQPHSTT